MSLLNDKLTQIKSLPSLLQKKKRKVNRLRVRKSNNKTQRKLSYETSATIKVKTTLSPRALHSAPTSPRNSELSDTSQDSSKRLQVTPNTKLELGTVAVYDELQQIKNKLSLAENKITTLTTNLHILSDTNEELITKIQTYESNYPGNVHMDVDQKIKQLKKKYKVNLQDISFQLKEALVDTVRLEEENLYLKTQLKVALSKNDRLQNDNKMEMKNTKQKFLDDKDKLIEDKNELLYERVQLESVIDSLTAQIKVLCTQLKNNDLYNIGVNNDNIINDVTVPEKPLPLDLTSVVRSLSESNKEKDSIIAKLEQQLAEATDLSRSDIIFKNKLISDQNYVRLNRKYRALKDKMVLLEQVRTEERALNGSKPHSRTASLSENSKYMENPEIKYPNTISETPENKHLENSEINNDSNTISESLDISDSSLTKSHEIKDSNPLSISPVNEPNPISKSSDPLSDPIIIKNTPKTIPESTSKDSKSISKPPPESRTTNLTLSSKTQSVENIWDNMELKFTLGQLY